MRKTSELIVDCSNWQKLVPLAVEYSHRPEIGEMDNWPDHFRSSMWALMGRVHGVQIHYRRLFTKSDTPRHPILDNEYDITTLLFCMASSLECASFALGVLGHAFRPDLFPKFNDLSRKIKKWSYQAVVGKPNANKSAMVFFTAFTTAFPRFQQKWMKKRVLIEEIFDYHNHSKHRAEGRGGSGVYDTEDFPEIWNPKQEIRPADARYDRSSWQSISVPQIPWKKQYEYRTIEELSLAYSGLILQSGRDVFEDVRRLPDTGLSHP